MLVKPGSSASDPQLLAHTSWEGSKDGPSVWVSAASDGLGLAQIL